MKRQSKKKTVKKTSVAKKKADEKTSTNKAATRKPKRTFSSEERSFQKGIADVRGFRAWGSYAGIKRKRRDVAMIFSDTPASAAAVFTQNQVVAAPIEISRKAIKNGKAQVFVINSGNANACTGEQGRKGAAAMVDAAADALEIDRDLVIISSTGIIGRTFPTDKVIGGIRECARRLSGLRLAGSLAANAILTTDTFPKASYSTCMIENSEVRMAGIAKGSGMIHPNMATMLAFIVSDAAIEPKLLNEALHEAVDSSFNMITVDGDTSTNDMVAVMCNGAAGTKTIRTKNSAYRTFRDELKRHCVELGRQIVCDGEGATKLIQYDVQGAPNTQAARKIARTFSNSNLVKTACFGRDPNWGRIVAAAGRAGVNFDPSKVALYMGTSKAMYKILDSGQPVEIDPKKLKNMMRAGFLYIHLDLNQGKGKATAWGSDLSYEYVRINAEYTT